MAKLYFSFSAMNAGKSTLLLQAAHNYHERGMHCLLLTSSVDDRAGAATIASRIGLKHEAQTFCATSDLFDLVKAQNEKRAIDCVFVDEAQFLNNAQVWQLAAVADDLAVPVMCYGLRTDFQGRLFAGSKALLAIADDLREIRTICWCGKKATMVVRLDDKGKIIAEGEQVLVGGEERYQSLCRLHWRQKALR